MSSQTPEFLPPSPPNHPGLETIVSKVIGRLERDKLIQDVIQDLRQSLGLDRLALYYFFSRWNGRVTFEALSQPQYSIIGMTGAGDCFNDEYDELYVAGRYRAFEDIESEPIHDCHRDFLSSIQLKPSLVVPILPFQGLWRLLAAHNCQENRSCEADEIAIIQLGEIHLATSPPIINSMLTHNP